MTIKDNDWRALIDAQRQLPYFIELKAKVEAARAASTAVYPPPEQTFYAFETTPFNDVKVVILGQDPYHQPGQAHGLAFSVPQGVRPPPSLRNVYKALERDAVEFTTPSHGNLEAWAQQGVLLLNTVLTVEEGKAHAHAAWGWERFTDAVIEALNAHPQPLVFMLWGKHAQAKGRLVTDPRHLCLHSVHPSPLSAHRGFLDCAHFSQANRFLSENGRTPINWSAVTAEQKQ
ncbi:uracil-DNA glycosylase [Aliidiomarina sp. Khilg15.8]